MTTELESGTLALCRELVRIESPSGGEQDVAAAVVRAMTALGYDEVPCDELGSVLGVRRGGSGSGVLLVDAHMVAEALAGLEGVTATLHAGELRCYTGRSFTVEAFHPGWAVTAEAEHAQCARGALREAGLDDAVFYAPYSTNATATAGQRGLPTLVYGAGGIEAAHAVDESVAEAELAAAARGYQALARALA